MAWRGAEWELQERESVHFANVAIRSSCSASSTPSTSVNSLSETPFIVSSYFYQKKKKKLGQDATDHILAFHPAHVITDRLPRFIIGQLSDSEVANVPLVSSNWQKVKTKWMERSREMRFSV